MTGIGWDLTDTYLPALACRLVLVLVNVQAFLIDYYSRVFSPRRKNFYVALVLFGG